MTDFNSSEFKNFIKEKTGLDIVAIFHYPTEESFLDFIDTDTQDITEFQHAGVYGIHCLSTNRTYIAYSINVIGEIGSDLYKFEVRAFEEADDLVEDYDKYSFENFIFVILVRGKGWEDLPFCRDEVKRIKTIWPFQLY